VSGPGSAVAGIDVLNNPCANPGIASGCYNGIITVTTPAHLSSESGGTQGLYFDQNGGISTRQRLRLHSVVEHETDEVLGTASCIDTGNSTLADGCDTYGGTGTPSAIDLYRYNSLNNLAVNSTCIGLTTCGGTPYFSYDGGNTNGNLFNPVSNGDDYSDFVAYGCGTPPYNVQDGRGCAGTHPWINSDGGAEINMLDAVGFNLNPVPEPGTLDVFGASIVTLAFLRRRYGRK